MANQSLPGYSQSVGKRQQMVMDHTGPKSYPTGGEALNAADIGWGGFDFVQVAAYSLSGTYQVLVLYPASGIYNVSNVKLAWYVTSTGLQVGNGTDLSAEHLRVMAFGV